MGCTGLKGTLSTEAQLTGELTATGTLTGELTIATSVASYDGDYTITPKAHEEQELECQGLLMAENVVVLQVPYWETSNQQDGLTVYIAEDSNG